MFNNRFNSSKKDPLVEAVKQAQADGDLRRQSEALVNETFGVYSRNAVIREELAAYDAALEEAYKCMKEGEQIDEISKKLAGSYIKTAHYRGGSADFKHGMIHGRELATRKKSKGDQADAKELSNTSLKREKGIGLATDKLTGKAKVQANEELAKKDLAKKDYDGDGKRESEKDEVWGSRFKAAKAAGKMEEEQIDELSKATLKSYRSNARQGVGETGYYADDSASSDKYIEKRGKGLVMSGKKLSGTAKVNAAGVKAKKVKVAKEEVDYSAPDRAAVTKDNKPVVSSTSSQADTSGPSASDKAALTSKIKSIKEAAYSAKAARAGKDIGKPGKNFAKIAKKAGEKYGSEERGKKVAGAILAKIRAKHMKEDQSFKSAQVTETNKLGLGKSVNEANALVPAGNRSIATTAAPRAIPKGSSGFTYSRLGDRPMLGGMNPEDRFGGTFKPAASTNTGAMGRVMNAIKSSAPTAARVLGKVAPVAGPVGLAATMVSPDSGKAMAASYKQGHDSFVQHPTTPGVKASDSFARMRQMSTKPAAATAAPAPATTQAAPAKQTFSQAFAAARKEAGGGKGQFEFGGKKYQTNLNPAKGAEKYIAPSAQKATSVSVPKPAAAAAAPAPAHAPAAAPETKPTPETSTPSPVAQTPGTATASVHTDNDRIKKLGGLDNPETSTAASRFPSFSKGVDTDKAVSANMNPEKTSGATFTPTTPPDTQKKLKEEVTVGDHKYRII